MKIDQYSRVTITESEAFEALYTNQVKTLDGVTLEDVSSIDQYNVARSQNADRIPELKELELFNESVKFFDEANQCNWCRPEGCNSFPMHQWLLNQCTNEQERARVDEELMLFIQHGMFDLLFYLKYLVDTMRENKIVWGVGRGSSVASYVLYLIGVHKINSLKYNLDIKEFLKEN